MVLSSIDSAIVTWKDPVAKNGLITKYIVYWKEMNKNRTKTAVTVPKTRSSVFSTRYRVSEAHPQYKMTGLREESRYEVWVAASTRIGEGIPSVMTSFSASKTIPARIIELGDHISVTAGYFTPFLLSCHVVGSDPVHKSWTQDG